jgi:parallel beta-helix repeat protein
MSTLASFGAVGDGIVDDRQALINFIAGDGDSIGAGTFRISSNVVFNKSNRTFTGSGMDTTTIIADTLIGFQIGNCADITFSDIHFTTSLANAITSPYGTWLFNNVTASNITFTRCRFSAPTSGGNALKLIVQQSIVSDIHFIDCEIVDTLRMGLEVQNHTAGDIERCTRIGIKNCLIKNCGFGLSLSGLMSEFDISGNTFDNMESIGIEGVGVHHSLFDNNIFQNFIGRYQPVAFTNTRTMVGNVISNNREINPGRKLAEWRVRNSSGMKLINNETDGGFIYLTYVNDSYVSENTVKSTGNYALMLEESGNNIVESNDLSNAGASNFSTVRCYGVGSTKNIIRGNNIIKGLGGSYYSQINGAANNDARFNWVNGILRTSDPTAVTSDITNRLKFNNIVTDYIIDCPSTTDFTILTDQAKWDFKFSNVEYPASMMLYTKVVNNRMLVHFRLTQLLTLKQLNRLISVYGLDWIPIWIRSRDTLTENLAIDKSKIIPYWYTTKTMQDTIYLPMYFGIEPIQL